MPSSSSVENGLTSNGRAACLLRGHHIFLALDLQAIDLQAIACGNIRYSFPGSNLSSRSSSMPNLESVRVYVIV